MPEIIVNKSTEQVITISPADSGLHRAHETAGALAAKTTVGLTLDEPPPVGETITGLDDLETDEVDDALESLLPDDHPIFLFHDRITVKAIFRSLGKTLRFLPSGPTFDAETLLHHIWNDVPASRHRTLGTILKFMVDAHMVPLRKVPKRNSGGRVRYTKI